MIPERDAMNARPLANRRFLVTRPENQSDHLATLLETAGAQAVLAPMIAIGQATDPAALDRVLARLADFDLAVFISPTALDEVAKRLPSWPDELPAAVIGLGSRDRAAALGIRDIICPETQFDSEALLAEPDMQTVASKRVVLFRGNGGRELLAETLTARGAIVEVVEAYRRLPPAMTGEGLALTLADALDGVIVTSSESVHNLFSLADDKTSAKLSSLLFFASHPRVAEVARQHGVSRVLLTAAGDAGIVATLNECFAGAEQREPAATSIPVQFVMEHPEDKPKKTASPRKRIPRTAWWSGGAVVVAVTASLLVLQLSLDEIRADYRKNLAKLSAEAQAQASRADREESRSRQLDGRINQLEQRAEELRAQQANLQGLYSTISGDRETTLLADAELTLSLAAQQLQLTGNVSAALAALYRLDERLAGFDKPTLINLRRAVARDIDAIKRQPYVDLVGLSAKLDSLANGIDKLPLRVDAKAVDGEVNDDAPPAAGNWLQRGLRDIGSALGAFVEIRRTDKPDAVLLAPAQALFLREHIKLRLLNARLALLQRDEASFRQDLISADGELRRYFAVRAKPVAATLASLKDLMNARPALELPNLADSVAAARDARRVAEKSPS